MATPASDLVYPEKRLLVCCARTRIEASVAERIRDVFVQPLDWDSLISAAAEHGVAPLLHRHLSTITTAVGPPEQLTRLKEHVHAASLRSLVLTAELIRILEALSTAGVKAIPYKGPVLAVQAYGDVALREFDDLDVVVRQRDIAAADRIFTQLGYSREFPPIFSPDRQSSLIPGEYNYRDRGRRLMVELHTEHTLRHFPSKPNLDELAGHLSSVRLSGHDVGTFGPEDTLVFLCVHGAKDFWQRLIWAADVAQLIGSREQFDWDRAYAFADAVRACRILHLGLALADRLFQISLPDEIRSRVRADAPAGSMAVEIERRLLGRTVLPLGARAAFAYRSRMVRGTLAGLRYAIRLATAPAADDWQSMRLPRPLAPLYAALRPFRLLRKYGVSGQPPARTPEV